MVSNELGEKKPIIFGGNFKPRIRLSSWLHTDCMLGRIKSLEHSRHLSSALNPSLVHFAANALSRQQLSDSRAGDNEMDVVTGFSDPDMKPLCTCHFCEIQTTFTVHK